MPPMPPGPRSTRPRTHRDRGPTDRQLVEAFLRDGSEAAFALLHRRHSPALYALALRETAGDSALADEVVQDAWVRAVRGLAAFRWESALSTWLTSIQLNGLRTRWRRATRHAARTDDVRDVADPSLEVRVDTIDVCCAIDRLPTEHREVLVLHAVHGFSHGEIGHQLGISVGTSRSRLCRARQALRAMLEPPVRRAVSGIG